MNEKFSKEEELFLDEVTDDYVSLSSMVRLLLDYRKIEPTTEEEYLKALDFLRYLLNKYQNKLKYYLGPGAKIIKKSPEELLVWLKEMWYAGKYGEIDYDIWFDLEKE
jgi:ABC-type transporter MlaC component